MNGVDWCGLDDKPKTASADHGVAWMHEIAFDEDETSVWDHRWPEMVILVLIGLAVIGAIVCFL